GFGLALSAPVAVAFNEGDVGMVSKPIDERDDAGGVGKDAVPVLEGEVGGDEQRAPLFIARVDDFVEEIGGVVVVGEVADLVDAEQVRSGVGGDLLSPAFGGG